jgi:hypothetical protein
MSLSFAKRPSPIFEFEDKAPDAIWRGEIVEEAGRGSAGGEGGPCGHQGAHTHPPMLVAWFGVTGGGGATCAGDLQQCRHG